MSRGTLVDSNVLLDILTVRARWADWSVGALTDAAMRGPLAINPIVYAEVSVRFNRIEDLEEALPPLDFVRAPLPREAGFLAGKVFVAYRRHGGTRMSTLPDCFIGAHATFDGLTLLTRDTGRVLGLLPDRRARHATSLSPDTGTSGWHPG